MDSGFRLFSNSIKALLSTDATNLSTNYTQSELTEKQQSELKKSIQEADKIAESILENSGKNLFRTQTSVKNLSNKSKGEIKRKSRSIEERGK